jgi:phage baseplate assembly protein gpV
VDTMQSTPTKRTRRYHPPDLKRQVVAASQQPGASVAGVALAHGSQCQPGSPLDEGGEPKEVVRSP